MSKLDETFKQNLSPRLMKGAVYGYEIKYNDLPIFKQQIKELFLELMKESYGTGLYGETTARDIYTSNLRQKVEEL